VARIKHGTAYHKHGKQENEEEKQEKNEGKGIDGKTILIL